MGKTKNITAFFSGVGAILASLLGVLLPWLQLMVAAMVLDYLTGMIAASWQGKLSSKIGIRGIFKKLAYMLMVAVGMIIDKVLLSGGELLGVEGYNGGTVALMIIIWIIINELLSILENLGRMQVPLPIFLHRIIQSLHSAVDGDNPNLKG